ncbi:uncharacterized protein LOC101849893 [Aplysia californica]|uniref:Uncharacterized protein LOC101849893 n=1 Tax=Aplysia californica TaxID=6500 RepID=A0ABM1W2P6_APLCA|nr:uncharacterized protein LOC101849893 [Aplysia californica]
MASEDGDSDNIDQPTNNIIPSFSFSGCGFLGVYHVGVAACLKDHTDVVNRKQIKFAGASAGALVATTLLCDIDLGQMTKLLLEVAKTVRNRENVDLDSLLRNLLNHYLPDDAHIRLRNRLYISVTLLTGLESGLITNFHSKEHLIQCLIASSFVPGFVGWIPPVLEAEDFINLSEGMIKIPEKVVDSSDCSSDDSETDKEEEEVTDGCVEARPPKVRNLGVFFLLNILIGCVRGVLTSVGNLPCADRILFGVILNLDNHAVVRLLLQRTVIAWLISMLICDTIFLNNSKQFLFIYVCPQCLIASSFVPGFVGWIPPVLEAEDFINLSEGMIKIPEKVVDSSDCSSDDSETDKEEEEVTDGCVEARPPKVCVKKDVDTVKVPSWDVCVDSSDSSISSDEDGAVAARQEEEKKKKEEKPKPAKRARERSRPQQPESYLKMLVRLCYMSIKTTSSVVRRVPGAAMIMDRMSPQLFGGLDGLMEALVLEVMSDRYAAVDGGFSDNIPCFDSHTITICPFSGESDICPRDLTALDFNIDLGRTSMHASEDNIFRLNHALSPMDPEMLLKLCEEGYNECLRFLHRKDLLSCKKHLMTRAAISSSPCNIGHAHCQCPLCKRADPKIRTSLSCIDCHKTKQKALVSLLPEDVRREFKKAIEEEKKQNSSANSNWNRLVALLWWCVENMYAGTIRLADLALDFYTWLMRFWDNLTCLACYVMMPMGQKRKMVRFLLASLKNSINASTQQRARRACLVQSGSTMCS